MKKLGLGLVTAAREALALIDKATVDDVTLEELTEMRARLKRALPPIRKGKPEAAATKHYDTPWQAQMTKMVAHSVVWRLGAHVRMTEEFKRHMRKASAGHVREFGKSVGVVVGIADWNAARKEGTPYNFDKLGPEVEVRWMPHGLKYMYLPQDLEPVGQLFITPTGPLHVDTPRPRLTNKPARKRKRKAAR